MSKYFHPWDFIRKKWKKMLHTYIHNCFLFLFFFFFCWGRIRINARRVMSDRIYHNDLRPSFTRLDVVQVHVFIMTPSLGRLVFKAWDCTLDIYIYKFIHHLTDLAFHPVGWHATLLTSRKASRGAYLDANLLSILLHRIKQIVFESTY